MEFNYLSMPRYLLLAHNSLFHSSLLGPQQAHCWKLHIIFHLQSLSSLFSLSLFLSLYIYIYISNMSITFRWSHIFQNDWRDPTEPGGRLNIMMSSYQYSDPMLKIRRSHDRLIFNMGITIPRKDGLYIEMGPWRPLCGDNMSWEDAC